MVKRLDYRCNISDSQFACSVNLFSLLILSFPAHQYLSCTIEVNKLINVYVWRTSQTHVNTYDFI